MKHKKNPISHFLNWLGSVFLNGLLTILPLTLTVALFTFAFKQIARWLEPIKTWLIRHNYLTQGEPFSSFSHLQFGRFAISIPYLEVFLVIIAIFIIGLIMRILILKRLIHTLLHGIEQLVFRIPLVRSVYSGIKQLVHAFSVQDKLTFKKVVLVEFPRSGIYSLGFLTSELPPEVAPDPAEKFYNVFIPTTPNPTSGFFVMIAEKNITLVDLTRQEAMAMIISGGIIQPDRYMQQE